MNAQWNAPISDRFSSLCARVFSPAAAILESEKTLGTRLALALSLAFAAENIKNLPLALLARKKLSVRLVGKSKRGCLFEEIKERGKFDRSRDMVSGS